MLTVHTSGGADMMAAAVEGAAGGAQAVGIERPRIIGVTVLTSLAARGDVLERVLERADDAVSAGIDGIVCSPREVGRIKQVEPGLEDAFFGVTGIFSNLEIAVRWEYARWPGFNLGAGWKHYEVGFENSDVKAAQRLMGITGWMRIEF